MGGGKARKSESDVPAATGKMRQRQKSGEKETKFFYEFSFNGKIMTMSVESSLSKIVVSKFVLFLQLTSAKKKGTKDTLSKQ